MSLNSLWMLWTFLLSLPSYVKPTDSLTTWLGVEDAPVQYPGVRIMMWFMHSAVSKWNMGWKAIGSQQFQSMIWQLSEYTGWMKLQKISASYLAPLQLVAPEAPVPGIDSGWVWCCYCTVAVHKIDKSPKINMSGILHLMRMRKWLSVCVLLVLWGATVAIKAQFMSVQMAGSERPQSLLHFLVVKKRKLQELCGEGTVSLCGQNDYDPDIKWMLWIRHPTFLPSERLHVLFLWLLRNPARFGQLRHGDILLFEIFGSRSSVTRGPLAATCSLQLL